MSDLVAGYPADYADPPWDGSTAEFRDIVVPARRAALERSLTALLAEMGFPDLRFELAAAEVSP